MISYSGSQSDISKIWDSYPARSNVVPNFRAVAKRTARTEVRHTPVKRLPFIYAVLMASLAGTPAPAQNSAPALVSLSPSTVPAGAGVAVTLNGSNLASGTDVLVGGRYGILISNSLCFSSNCPIAYVGGSQMTVSLSSSLVASPGTVLIQVVSPSGVASNALTLTVVAGTPNLVPSIASLSPSGTTAGGAAFTLTVNGANFVAASVVQWNGSSRPSAFAGGAQLTASISASDIAHAGTVPVAVFNPGPGAGRRQAFRLPSTRDCPQPLQATAPRPSFGSCR